MNTAPSFYEIVKLCKGGLTLDLPAFDSSAQNRVVTIDWNVNKIRIPRQYALGIFVDGTLQKMYEEGYFTVEPAATFTKEVAEIFYPVENKVNVASDEEILMALKKGDRVKIKKIVESGVVNKDKVIVLARENIGLISTSMVRDLEKLLSVELVVDGENDGE